MAVTIRLWDAYLVEGEVYLLRAALGILRLYSSEILAMDGIEEVCIGYAYMYVYCMCCVYLACNTHGVI